MRPRLIYLVTEDWYFLSHRLPMARAALAAGFDVHVVTRVVDGGGRIEAEGFVLHGLDWDRRDASVLRALAHIGVIRQLLWRLQPGVLHNIALKPAILGSIAALGLRDISIVNSINGLGSGYTGKGASGAVQRKLLRQSLRVVLTRPGALTVVQNGDDRTALRDFGVPVERLRQIPGSGVDTLRFQPLPDPSGPPTIAYVGRMLADKGVRTVMAAHRLLRERGLDVRLLLAGMPDPGNVTSITNSELDLWSAEPGVTWLRQVNDIAEVWRRAHVAVLMSRREGLPLSLLEAAACGRPMIASDVPGCRDVVRSGETGLLVPQDDPVALSNAMAELINDPGARTRMGAAARKRAEQTFGSTIVAEQAVQIYREQARPLSQATRSVR
jgi:glycosyltransferase involved in cell wall biosynthesis